MDKTHGQLHACAPIEALDASMYSFVISKVHTPSVAKLFDSGRLLLLLFTLQAAALLRWPLSISSVRHHYVKFQLSTPSILRLAAVQHLDMACTNHWIYMKVKKR